MTREQAIGVLILERAWQSPGVVDEAVAMAISALLEQPTCDGCRWWGVRPQKCSCCRRNLHMKDNYEVDV